jgi:Tfp pilus assembly protein PilO
MNGSNRPTGGALTALHVHLIGGSVCAVLAALAWFTCLGPVLAARSEARAQRIAIAQQQREADELGNQVVQVERLISRARYEEQQSPLRLEAVERINRRLSEVSELAADTGLDVSVIQPGQVRSQPRFEIVPIRLEGSGTFRKTALFLHAVHATFPDMGVAAVQVTGRPNDAAGVADFALTLVWYAAPGRAQPRTAEVAPATR